jgi:hypothetical protein
VREIRLAESDDARSSQPGEASSNSKARRIPYGDGSPTWGPGADGVSCKVACITDNLADEIPLTPSRLSRRSSIPTGESKAQSAWEEGRNRQAVQTTAKHQDKAAWMWKRRTGRLRPRRGTLQRPSLRPRLDSRTIHDPGRAVLRPQLSGASATRTCLETILADMHPPRRWRLHHGSLATTPPKPLIPPSSLASFLPVDSLS